MSVIGNTLRMLYNGTCVLWTPWDQEKCPDSCADYQGVLISRSIIILCDKAPFGTTA